MIEQLSFSPIDGPKEARRRDYLRSDRVQDHGSSQSRHGHEDSDEMKKFQKIITGWETEDKALAKARNRAVYAKHLAATGIQEVNDARDESGHIKTQWDEELNIDSTASIERDDTGEPEEYSRLLFTTDRDSDYTDGFVAGVSEVEIFNYDDDNAEPVDEPGEWIAEYTEPYGWETTGTTTYRYEINEIDSGVDEVEDDVDDEPAVYLRDHYGEFARAFVGHHSRPGNDAAVLTEAKYLGTKGDDDLSDYMTGIHVVDRR